MRGFARRRLMTQMFAGQAVIGAITGLVLVGTALFIAPAIFDRHLLEAGITSTSVQLHVADAFSAAMTFSLILSAVASLIISGFIAWYFMLRIVRPIEDMATFAQALAAGQSEGHTNFNVSTPEIDQLAQALIGMSRDLALSKEEQARMLSDLAHELRTPIATVGAIVDGIEDGVVKSDPNSWKTIRDQLERLNRLSRDVRNVSDSVDQVLNMVVEPFKPADLSATAFAAWRPRFENKGVFFEMRSEGNLPLVEVDSHRIGQVLSNLLENALRHTATGGNVEMGVVRENDFVQFSIQDSGDGIEPHQLPHIFERLYRGDSARRSGDSGSGLGLTIARSIAQSHGGTLTAKSGGHGTGTTFTLTLPALQR
ncbi:MAG: HAMP domain-containing histidine kinase [Actinobacteria bacterium]|nr:HAMP domain-containing histidine kinase [Actinomycetota bacterium]